MNNSYAKIFSIMVLLLLLLPMVACGGDDDEATGITPTSTETGQSCEEFVITIGNLTDITGVSSNAQEVINLALEDLVNYFNDENLIPGIELKIVTYDGQFDPARDISGYEWLKQKGADLLVSGVTSTPITLKPIVDDDQMLLFSLSGALETLTPQGYVFAPASLAEHEGLTLMKWIAENDWDYQTKEPATIGAAFWGEPNAQAFIEQAEAYAKAHPDQFDWVDTFTTQVGSFIWTAEADALKDCDYVFTNAPIVAFVREYRNAGGTGKLIGGGPHVALMRLVDDANLWDEIDGMLFVTPSQWWGEKGELIELREQLLYENHPDRAEEIKRMGGAYNALDNFYVVLDIIRIAAENVGPANVDSAALYEAANSYSLVADGVERYSFGETKRYACNVYSICEAQEELRDLVRIEPEWIPTVTEP